MADPVLRPPSTAGGQSLEQVLVARVRERADPRLGDHAYVHLRDLRDAVAASLRDVAGTWLDYGAGTSPYRDLLPGATVVTADLPGGERYRVDLELDASGACPVPDMTFDGVLSTQVLEHVTDPVGYLREAHRVLRPGGRLVLSTHGVWEEHGGQDLWRWTADGLALLAGQAGFADVSVRRLTADARAVLLLFRRQGRAAQWPAGGVVGLLLRLARYWDRLRPEAFDRYCDEHFRGVGGEQLFYIAVLLEARRRDQR
jgi:SAM-dependent methyltransferase